MQCTNFISSTGIKRHNTVHVPQKFIEEIKLWSEKYCTVFWEGTT